MQGNCSTNHVSRDPSELQALREARRDLEAVLHSTADEIFVTDGYGLTVRVSSGCERNYGVDAGRLVGRSVFDLEKEGIFAPSATIAALKERQRVTIVQTTCNGHHLLVTATPYQGEDGSVVRVVCNSRDLTDLFELRSQLTSAEELVRKYQSELAALRAGETLLPEEALLTPGLDPALHMAKKVAAFDSTVLILGESGVGKDVLAQYIHRSSARSGGPFIRVNCGAIPETLLESELFGYDRGAFTGARKEGRSGHFELANGGTIFLDEISELPLPLQVKLLQVVQLRQFTRVGGSKPIKINVRLVATSNRDLKKMVADGAFRADLYYRLNVVPIQVPPLRKRVEDVPHLARYFLDRWKRRLGLDLEFSPEAIKALPFHTWPGNVRELENMVERLVVTADGSVIGAADVVGVLDGSAELAEPHIPPASPTAPISLKGTLAEAEARLVRDAYEQSRGNSYRVARLLGVSQASAFRKIQKYVKNAESN